MTYQGSKARLVKYIAPILQKCIDDNNVEQYVEPFVGGANMIVNIRCKRRIGSDINEELIAFLRYMQDNPEMEIFPEDLSREHYDKVRDARKNGSNEFSKFYTAGIGYFGGYNGRYFDGGWGVTSKSNPKRNRYKEKLLSARRQAPKLKDIGFAYCSYDKWKGEKGCVFYLDPPYKDTKQYDNFKFDYEAFYNFCRELSKDNFVFISEYQMPADFECIWSKEVSVNQSAIRTEGLKRVEKLFVVKK